MISKKQKSNIGHVLIFTDHMSTLIERTKKTILMNISSLCFLKFYIFIYDGITN